MSWKRYIAFGTNRNADAIMDQVNRNRKNSIYANSLYNKNYNVNKAVSVFLFSQKVNRHLYDF